jgi:hypothetical protein
MGGLEKGASGHIGVEALADDLLRLVQDAAGQKGLLGVQIGRGAALGDGLKGHLVSPILGFEIRFDIHARFPLSEPRPSA